MPPETVSPPATASTSAGSTVRQVLLITAACLPPVLSFAASWAGPRAAESAPAAERCPLAFHQYMVNLGDVPARRNHYARFAFTNTGPSPIEIRELQTSCGCLSDHLEKRIFAAGETGELLLRIQTANQNPGKKEYTCRVITGPPDQADIFWSTDLVFRVILPEQSVTLNPRALIVHQYTNEPTRHVVRVHDTRSRTLTARQVTCNAPFVTARLLPASSLSEQDTDYGVVEQVEVVVSATPPGQHDVVIRVLTDDREFSVVKIPVRVYGPSPPDTDPSESSGSPDGTPPFVE